LSYRYNLQFNFSAIFFDGSDQKIKSLLVPITNVLHLILFNLSSMLKSIIDVASFINLSISSLFISEFAFNIASQYSFIVFSQYISLVIISFSCSILFCFAKSIRSLIILSEFHSIFDVVDHNTSLLMRSGCFIAIY
jgi:hypothetical protein